MIDWLTTIVLTPGGSTTVHIRHKQYIQQHSETEYTEWNIHSNNNNNIT